MAGLTRDFMIKALRKLDSYLDRPVKLIIGGGGAMILAYNHPLVTHDIDSFPKGITVEELDKWVKKVSQDLGIPGDWLNPYFSTFTHTLPTDFEKRTLQVFQGTNIEAWALGKEEMLLMKCFAHRPKDIGHAKALIKLGANVQFVEEHIERLREKGLPGALEALDFLDDLLEHT